MSGGTIGSYAELMRAVTSRRADFKGRTTTSAWSNRTPLHGRNAPLTTPTAARASLHATLDANEDPADLYRLWIPARRTVTVTARSTHAVRVRVWGPRTRSIAETAAAAKRDLAASSTTRVRVANASTHGGYYYADVRLARGIRSGTYNLTVATGALAKR